MSLVGTLQIKDTTNQGHVAHVSLTFTPNQYKSENLLWVKKNILNIVVTNFVNIQLIELFKNIFENLHLKKIYDEGCCG